MQKATFRWTEIELEAYDCLRDKLKNAPFVQYPNDAGVFTLETDASTKSVGYILYQSRPNEPDGIVACGGRSLRAPEFNYTVTELKMLSIVDALNKFRHFLLSRHFIIKSDHICLRFINSLKDSSTGHLFRWSSMIQGFDFEIIYVKGSSHTIADSLFRRDYPECTDSTMDKLNHDQSVHIIKPGVQSKGDDSCLNALCEQIYDTFGNLTEMFKDLVAKRISYLLFPGSYKKGLNMSAGGYLLLEDVVEWLIDDSGIMVSVDYIRETVALYMQGRVETANYIIFVCSKQRKDGTAQRDSLMQTTAKHPLGKHCFSQNAWSQWWVCL